jgi:hypothetical protein
MTSRRLHLLLAAFTTAFALTFASGALPSDAEASSGMLCTRKDTSTMKIENTSARLVHLNLGTEVKTIAPLKTLELQGEDAERAKAVLDGPLIGLVDNGELVVDGKPKAPPASIEPSQPARGAPDLQTGKTLLDDPERRDTDQLPPAQAVPSGAADTPATHAGSKKR